MRFAIFALCLAGCFGTMRRAAGPDSNRVRFDLQCNQEAFNWTRLDNNTWGVEGCGKRATYHYASGGWIKE